MTKLTRVPVQDVAPNPYQTRFDESPERIATIALSIAQDGLLQPPTVAAREMTCKLKRSRRRLARPTAFP